MAGDQEGNIKWEAQYEDQGHPTLQPPFLQSVSSYPPYSLCGARSSSYSWGPKQLLKARNNFRDHRFQLYNAVWGFKSLHLNPSLYVPLPSCHLTAKEKDYNCLPIIIIPKVIPQYQIVSFLPTETTFSVLSFVQSWLSIVEHLLCESFQRCERVICEVYISHRQRTVETQQRKITGCLLYKREVLGVSFHIT